MAGVNGPAESGQDTLPGLSHWNELSGGDGFDLLVGTARSDSLEGGLRADNLYGLGGGDTLVGNRASVCLSGGPEGDRLFDDDLNEVEPDDSDTLWGGWHIDRLNAKDGDTRDSLRGESDGNPHGNDVCTSDPGDIVGTERDRC